ncbi:hypothetical protein ACQ3MN_07850 [Enterococcus faecalis]
MAEKIYENEALVVKDNIMVLFVPIMFFSVSVHKFFYDSFRF